MDYKCEELCNKTVGVITTCENLCKVDFPKCKYKIQAKKKPQKRLAIVTSDEIQHSNECQHVTCFAESQVSNTLPLHNAGKFCFSGKNLSDYFFQCFLLAL